MTARTRRPGARVLRALVGLLAGVLVLSGCSIYDAPLPGGPDTGKNPMKVTVMFRDVLDLVPQSTVKVDDVTVGKVEKIDLKGYVAKVTISLPRKVDLPDNATATIRQTSLLGEKFVDLEQPRSPSSNKLTNGDVIGLDRTGRNPEVEEVFGALALLLNGGGVGQLKTIASELNNAFGGRESEVRSVLDQIREFTTTLDQNKSSVVEALENTNRLAVELRKQDKTIKSTLDDVPSALASINRQRDDLVLLLKSLTRLSGVGVKVIQASKASTIDSLQNLAPVLNSFAKAGQNLPKSFQVFLTYPFVDAAVGNDPQVARNLHIGDYTNLAINLNVDIGDLPLAQVCGTVRDTIKQEVQDPANSVPAPAQQAIIAVLDAAPCDQLGDIAKTVGNTLTTVITALCGIAAIPGVCTEGGLPTIELPTLPLPAIPTTVPGLPNVLNGVTSQLPGVLGGSSSSSSGGLGSLLPRSQLGSAFQKTQQIDPFNLAAAGYSPGVGTILMQGVATQK